MITQHQEHEDKEQDGDGVPRQLVVDVGSGSRVAIARCSLEGSDIQAVDHDQTEDREQCGDRQEEGIGVGHAPPDDDVRDQRQCPHDTGRDPKPRMQALTRRPRNLLRAQDTDPPREDQQDELKAAAGALPGWASDRMCGGRRAHGSTGRQYAGRGVVRQARSRRPATIAFAPARLWAEMPLVTRPDSIGGRSVTGMLVTSTRVEPERKVLMP